MSLLDWNETPREAARAPVRPAGAPPRAAWPDLIPRGPAHTFRVFWCCAGDILFRDETGAIRPVNVTTARAVRANLWNMARDARGEARTRLSTIYAEATEAIEDLMRWRGLNTRRPQ